jgi:hypothetical protein
VPLVSEETRMNGKIATGSRRVYIHAEEADGHETSLAPLAAYMVAFKMPANRLLWGEGGVVWLVWGVK